MQWASSERLVLLLASAKFALHMATASRYGIFRDELYYLACAEHLDFGYVDQPPMIAVVAWITRAIFGDWLPGLRLPAALAGAALVWLTGKLARDLGGGRFAQALAALSVIVVPLFFVLHHWITMNAFEPLIWVGCAWCVVRAIQTGRGAYWLAFGALAGLGMETKYTIAFFVAGVCVGLLATPERKFLGSRWFWIGAVIAVVLFLPNLIWLVRHDFPFLELMGNIRRSGRDVVRAPLPFILDQVQIINPALFPLWAGGLGWLLFSRRGRPYRALGWSYLAVLIAMIALGGKNYYLVSIYPVLFAAGAVAAENWTDQRLRWGRAAYVAIVVGSGAVLSPLFVPILEPDRFVRYQAALGVEPVKAENIPSGPLPQYFADEFGWEEMTREVARIYHSLTREEQAKTAIFANSYGQAGAIDFFGPRYGLPKSICKHQNYWLWGPRGYTGEIVIVLGSDGRGDREQFRSVEVAGRSEHPYSRLDERYDIFLCRGLTPDLRTLWPSLKHWN
jgi:hypothetical protein